MSSYRRVPSEDSTNRFDRSGSVGSAGSGLQPSSPTTSQSSHSQTQQQSSSSSPFPGPLQPQPNALPPASQTPVQQQQQQAVESQRRSIAERVQDKCLAALWVFIAAAVAWFTDFWNVILFSSEANRPLLQISAFAVGIIVSLVLYLAIYLPRVKGLDSSAWHVYCPRAIPTMIVTGFVTTFLLIRATWPVWGFMAPLVLGIEAFGVLFALHFIPFC